MIKSKCIQWYYNDFKQGQLFKSMERTFENSPYHREKNVGIHTDMVVSEYFSRSTVSWTKYEVLGFLVCVFHDTGKPYSEISKYSEKHGNYKAYHGHELSSSRIWEDFICENPKLQADLGLSNNDIYGISWMIEHHVPWSTVNNKKLTNYALTILSIFNDNYQVFINVLLSDTFGRISDDAELRQNESIEWTNKFKDLIYYAKPITTKSDKTLYVAIGPSGCGKSTYYSNNDEFDNVLHFSLDKLRVEMYPADSYNESWKLACDDKEFRNKANAEFIKMIKSNQSIYVDNTNISKKSRNFYITEAKSHGYKLVALVFPLSVLELRNRQNNRTDKILSEDVYSKMYRNLQQPSYGEFDIIKVIK